MWLLWLSMNDALDPMKDATNTSATLDNRVIESKSDREPPGNERLKLIARRICVSSALCESAQLSQTDAAVLVHASLGAWQKWEQGDRRMHPAFWELFQLKIEVGS